MKRRAFYPLALLLTLLTALPAAGVAASLPDFVTLSKQLKPAVVNISTAKTVKSRRPSMPGPRSPHQDFFEDFFERFFEGMPQGQRKAQSLGSGVIISHDGYILTNDHVVNGADEIEVKLSDGRTFTASIKGQDDKLDLALLQIDTGEDLPVAELGNSEALEIGEWVMAIGNPFGLEQTVTAGIVSAKGRVIGAGPYDNFIQTDASINPGNSGGPLFNLQGEVVGVNTAIVAGGTGIGFAIPINAAKEILPQLKTTGHVVRGWLGVSIQQMNEELAESFGLEKAYGALVTEVVKDSPAEQAGVRRGDVILSYEGKELEDMKDLPRLVAATPVDTKVQMIVFRDGKKKKLKVTVGKLKDARQQAEVTTSEGGHLGLTVVDISPEVMRRFNLETGDGVLITGIDRDGPAAKANLTHGDVILEVNGKEIKNVGDFRALVGKTDKGEVLRLLIRRGESILYTTLQAD